MDGMPRANTAYARHLEAQVDYYPEDRGSILLEAAEQWRQAGVHERAIELLRTVATLGGEDGGYGRAAMIEILHHLGREDEVQEQLVALRADNCPSPAPLHLMGELIEDRGDLEDSLAWFTMAAARLSEEDDEGGVFSFTNEVLRSRRRIRRKLGLPADQLDLSAQDIPRELLRIHPDGVDPNL